MTDAHSLILRKGLIMTTNKHNDATFRISSVHLSLSYSVMPWCYHTNHSTVLLTAFF